MSKKMKNKPLKIALGLLSTILVILVIALVVLLNMDWNRAKPWLNARTSAALGRPFAIKGDLSLTWEKQFTGPETGNGWRSIVPWPHLLAKDIQVGQPADLPPPAADKTSPAEENFAVIQEISFALNPLALLEKRIAIPVLRFRNSSVSLHRFADGKNNWTFGNDKKASPWHLDLERVVFSEGKVHYQDVLRHADIMVDINTIDADPAYGVSWTLKGKMNQEAITGSGKAGAILSLQKQTVPYPIMANVQMGKTVIAVEGTLTKPSDLAALDMRLKLSGISMARLYALTGIVFPETPPYSTEGHLIASLGKNKSHWSYEKFSGKVGSTDIGGNIDYEARQPRPLLAGKVISHTLQFSDLGPLVGADSNANKVKRGAQAVQPDDKVLPVEAFRTERWHSIDADVDFTAEKIIREKQLPLKNLHTKLQLQDGVLTLKPLDFELAGGQMHADIKLDGSGKVDANAIKAVMKVTARHIKLKQLFPSMAKLDVTVGEINGDASLSATGNSVASLLGASNGEIKAMIDHGSISKLLLEEMGLNIGNIILTRIAGDKQVQLNCMVSDFEVSSGVANIRGFVVDTDEAVLDITGSISMAQEQLNLTIKPNSKGLRVLSLRSPLYVRGSFIHPVVSVDKGVLAMRAGGAIALAVVAPLTALLPLIHSGPDKDSDCARLLSEAKVAPVAPPPGKPFKRKVK